MKKFAANAVSKVKNALLCLKTLLGPANESFFFQSLAVLHPVPFFPKKTLFYFMVFCTSLKRADSSLVCGI